MSYEWIFVSPEYVLTTMLKFFFSVKLPTSDRNFCLISPIDKKPSKAQINQLLAEISDYLKIYEMNLCSKSFPGRLC